MFEQLYMCVPREFTDEEQDAYKAVKEYHALTEAFDDIFCTGKSKYDGCSIPINGWERGKSNSNAIKTKRELMVRYNVSTKHWFDANKLFNSMSS